MINWITKLKIQILFIAHTRSFSRKRNVMNASIILNIFFRYFNIINSALFYKANIALLAFHSYKENYIKRVILCFLQHVTKNLHYYSIPRINYNSYLKFFSLKLEIGRFEKPVDRTRECSFPLLRNKKSLTNA